MGVKEHIVTKIFNIIKQFYQKNIKITQYIILLFYNLLLPNGLTTNSKRSSYRK